MTAPASFDQDYFQYSNSDLGTFHTIRFVPEASQEQIDDLINEFALKYGQTYFLSSVNLAITLMASEYLDYVSNHPLVECIEKSSR